MAAAAAATAEPWTQSAVMYGDGNTMYMSEQLSLSSTPAVAYATYVYPDGATSRQGQGSVVVLLVIALVW